MFLAWGTVNLAAGRLANPRRQGAVPDGDVPRRFNAAYHCRAELISLAVWLYFQFPPSLRMVEVMLAAGGISVAYETMALKISTPIHIIEVQHDTPIPTPGRTPPR
jgi:hypothetical protein